MKQATCDPAPATTPAAAFGAALRLLGYEPGAPDHIPTADVAGDALAYRTGRCQGCGRRSRSGLDFHPWHCGKEYRAWLVCRHCGHAEEV